MTTGQYYLLNKEDRRDALTKCCGASAWVEGMLEQPQVNDIDQLLEQAKTVWHACDRQDILEAFAHHPKIGDIDSLSRKFASTAEWAAGEQAAVQKAAIDVISALAEKNQEYEEKFGYIFIVCATGKSAEEMLSLLLMRLKNAPDEELRIAAGEQLKITLLRLQKLFAI